MIATDTNLVFVYGNLRRGLPNHSWLAGSRLLLGMHRTAPHFTMRDLGSFPAVVCAGDTAIVGEVYAIQPRILQELDELTGFPQLYKRLRMATPWGWAWIYLLPAHAAADAPLVPHGDWVLWLEQRGDCGLGVY